MNSTDLERERIRRETRHHRPEPPTHQPPAPWLGYVAYPSYCYPGYFLDLWPYTCAGSTYGGYDCNLYTAYGPARSVYLAGSVYAYAGEILLAEAVGSRWAAQSFLPIPPTYALAGCPCTKIPGTLYLHVGNPSVIAPEIFTVPATLVYGPKPAALAVYNSDPIGYYSTADFWTADGNFHWMYWFGCQNGVYFLQLLMLPIAPGFAGSYPGSQFIMSWLVGLSGNTCSPFSLTNGATNSIFIEEAELSINGHAPA